MGYDNWCAVAAYFDGDGSLDVDARKYTLHWVLSFTDNWSPQLVQIKEFLEGKDVRVGTVRPTGTGGFKVEVAEIRSLKICASKMLAVSCLFKKRGELKIMASYFEGTITADAVCAFLNKEVQDGKRVGKHRSFGIPFTYLGGKQLCRNAASLRVLSESERSAVRRRYAEDGATIYQIASAYQVSPATIFRSIRGLERGGKTQEP